MELQELLFLGMLRRNVNKQTNPFYKFLHSTATHELNHLKMDGFKTLFWWRNKTLNAYLHFLHGSAAIGSNALAVVASMLLR